MKRSSSHRLLAHGRTFAAGCIVLLLLVAGAWSSWNTAHHIVLAKGREHGTMAVTGCGEDVCTGSFAPDAQSQDRATVTIQRSVAVKKGDRFPVVVKPGSGDVVRTGTPGFLHAWLPLGGALLLAALVIGGGLRLTRTAWGAAITGAALLTATFIAL
ncbi:MULTISPECIES: hypothetical protein [Streptomyces]|uniref:hypothetical protein n=1 Tax=Streptomyces TaxID=1883 RepID=UPI0006FDBDEE|nr:MULTISPECIES: hypothetical protein [unclassified Streptomyces]KQX90705.1 hypothetical protein ASD26_24990 [Streptomyces sp. Root1319]KQZ03401.1 hypothetical protein ASD51_20070 [Streptomyces sp. Root55]MDX3062563.1 hypothetical protein [Streptomyces sp. ND04-05B]WRY82534.1 hypothetical protein OG388_15535 [Streptomyces clavifer]